MKPYILLTPGPLTTSETVKEAMLTDWCTWDADYNVHIVEEIRKSLVALATKQTDEYTSVLLQGSGTYCVEAVIGSTVKPGDKLLILSNGAYGDRMGNIAEYHGINYDMLPLTEPEQNLSSIRITKTMVVLMEDIRNSTLKVEMAMISLVTSLEVCSVAEETTKDSIEAVSIKEVLALLMDLEVVDSEVDPSDRKVPTHTQISLLVLMKRLRAAIKSFICKIKMVRCSHYRFIYQPELIQEKVSA